MQLKLKNFKQYTQKAFDFPDVGMILLKGISGAGKSTIMQAIDFAVNGTKVKKSWNGGNPTVELTWPTQDLKIVRTSAPDTLTVTTEQGEFRDDEAQIEIYRKLCGGKERFSVSSYIKQRMKGALINLGPAEQLRLIQSLAFGKEDPEVIKAEISATLKAKNEAATSEANRLSDRQAVVAGLKSRIEKAEAEIKEPLAPCEPVQMAMAHGQFKALMEEQKAIEEELRGYLKEMSNPLYSLLVAHTQTDKQIRDQLDALKDRRRVCFERERELTQEDVALVPPIWDQAVLDAKIRYFENTEKVKVLVQEVRHAYSDFKGTGLGQWLASEIEKTKAEIDKIEPQHLQKMTEFQTLLQTQDGQPCPQCGTALSVTAGKIHKHTGVSDRAKRIEALKTETAGLGGTMKGLNNHLFALQRFQSRAADLKAVLADDPQPEIRDHLTVERERKRILEYATAKQRIATELASVRSEIVRGDREAIALNTKRESLVKDLDAAMKLVPIEHLRQKEHETNAKIAGKKAQVKIYAELVEKIERYSTEMQKINQARAVITEIKSQLAGATQQVADQEKLVAAAREAVGAWTRMRELSDLAAVQAVEDKIDDINNNAVAYLARLFPDDGTIVKILNTSKNQKGEEKAKLSLEITHKGHDAGKDDGELSGGEQDRTALAFQLAMSDMYSSPLLMVDEGFAGADVEKTLSLGLGVLKDFSSDKLVLVVQHGAPEEFFDEVVELG